MTENNKQPPRIPDDAKKDIPLTPKSKTENITPRNKHAWGVENFKNSSAYSIIAFCLTTLVILAFIVQIWFSHDETEAVKDVIDILKAVLMTALGFLFGRSSK